MCVIRRLPPPPPPPPKDAGSGFSCRFCRRGRTGTNGGGRTRTPWLGGDGALGALGGAVPLRCGRRRRRSGLPVLPGLPGLPPLYRDYRYCRPCSPAGVTDTACAAAATGTIGTAGNTRDAPSSGGARGGGHKAGVVYRRTFPSLRGSEEKTSKQSRRPGGAWRNGSCGRTERPPRGDAPGDRLGPARGSWGGSGCV